ncbi:MAG: hypothetical protein IT345_15760, partial [Trueperaceae bacterium]|nr:hypothetical protein [Trueperaceae bacterium]
MTYAVSGTLFGLEGTGLVLTLNGVESLSPDVDGAFAFAAALEDGTAYSVTVTTQPIGPVQTCVVVQGSGTISGADASAVSVTCTTVRYSIAGTLSGLEGTGVTLSLNGTASLSRSVNGAFGFTETVADGEPYVVTVTAEPVSPVQTCVVAQGSGVIDGADVTDVIVTCTTVPHTVGGSVSGLEGTGLSLTLGTEVRPILADGDFTFATPVLPGVGYTVGVGTPPSGPAQTCTVSNGQGTMPSADVTDVSVTCVTDSYPVGGSVTGLEGTVWIQLNGDEVLGVTGGAGSFSFVTGVEDGQPYEVSIIGQPVRRRSGASPLEELCELTAATGVMDGASVQTIQLSCQRAVWTTLDQTTYDDQGVITQYTARDYSSSGGELEDRYLQSEGPGTDGVWFTQDDTNFFGMFRVYNEAGNLIHESTVTNIGLDGVLGTL